MMNKEIKIRQAAIEDAEAIAGIEQITSGTPWSLSALENDIANNERAIVIVAATDKDIVAYADAWKVADELQLNNIAVIESFRGRHIASEMLDVLSEIGREIGCSLITLEVREGNAAGRGLYEKSGFRTVGIRENYYIDNNENAILMDLTL